MTGALEGGEWSAARPGRILPPGKDRVPILQEAGNTMYYIILYYIILYYIILYYTIPYQTKPIQTKPNHTTSHHITSYRIVSYHISYHIIYYIILYIMGPPSYMRSVMDRNVASESLRVTHIYHSKYFTLGTSA